MNRFAAFISKEFLHILRDTRTILIMLVLPISLIGLFGFALSLEVRSINVAIVSSKRISEITDFVHNIESNKYFVVQKTLDSQNELESLMRRGDIDIALVLDKDFNFDKRGLTEARIDIIVDASNPNVALSELMYLKKQLDLYLQGYDTIANNQYKIVSNIRMLYNPKLLSSYNFLPGVMGLIFILICSLMTSVTIVRERERRTMEILLISPIKPIEIVFAKMIPYLIVSCIVLICVFAISFLFLDIPVSFSVWSALFVSFIYIILSLSIGLLVSTFVQTQIEATLIVGVILMLPMLMLSGMVFPIESMPKIFEWLSLFIPAKWYISAMRKLLIQGVEIYDVVKEMIVLTFMTIITLVFSVQNFSKK